MPPRLETDLYEPIKRYLEAAGFTVKGEVNGCDLVALRGDDENPVIVELKKQFTVELLLQGTDRLRLSDQVYVAVEDTGRSKGRARRKWTDSARLCRMLGLGLITVHFYPDAPTVRILCEPKPYKPRKNTAGIRSLLAEFTGRSGDDVPGGSRRRKLVTVYREQALRCARMLHREGPASPKQLTEKTGVKQAPGILRDNHYGWFVKVERGVYALSASGQQALADYAEVLSRLFYTDSNA